MYRSHKIKLDPTPIQEQFFWKCLGVARFAYNWSLAEWQRQHKAGGKPNQLALRRQLNSIKKSEFPWMYDVPKGVVQNAVINLGEAFSRFFKKKARYPKFKSRRNQIQSIRLDDGSGKFELSGKAVKLPKLGWVKTWEELRFAGKPMSVVLRREGERWFVSVLVEIEDRMTENQSGPVGIDLGLKSAVTLSDGTKFNAPKPLAKALDKLAFLQRRVSRKKKGSKNREKAKAKVSRQHWRIGQIRQDWQHKITSFIAKTFGIVCVEDLNVAGMLRNSKLARAIADVGWGELVRQLSYKTDVVRINRWFPSSKTCSVCDYVLDELSLDIRTWMCPDCGAIHDRDVNAARNILVEGLRSRGLDAATASYAGSNVCGEESSGLRSNSQVKLSSLKQKLGISTC